MAVVYIKTKNHSCQITVFVPKGSSIIYRLLLMDGASKSHIPPNNNFFINGCARTFIPSSW